MTTTKGPTAGKARRADRLPPLSNELLEFYPSMSAQNHEQHVRDYARAAIAFAALDDAPAPAEGDAAFHRAEAVWQKVDRMLSAAYTCGANDIPLDMLKARATFLAALNPTPRPAGELERHQPCGCVMCICEDERRCHGCGAKRCGTMPHPPYKPAAAHREVGEEARPGWVRDHDQKWRRLDFSTSFDGLSVFLDGVSLTAALAAERDRVNAALEILRPDLESGTFTASGTAIRLADVLTGGTDALARTETAERERLKGAESSLLVEEAVSANLRTRVESAEARIATLESEHQQLAQHASKQRERINGLEGEEADAKRYRFWRERLMGADFDYGVDGGSASVLVFLLPDNAAVSANLDATTDALLEPKDGR